MPKGKDFGLKTRIWAPRPGYELRRGWMEKKKKEKEEEKFLLCESIGHRPLWGHCPKGDGNVKLIHNYREKNCIKRNYS